MDSPTDHSHTSPAMHPLEQQRRANRDAIAALGVDPYGQRTEGIESIAHARDQFDEGADARWKQYDAARKTDPSITTLRDPRPVVRVAGRVVLKREGGKLIWMQIRDCTSGPEDEPGPGGVRDLQIAVSKADCAAPGFEVTQSLDLGDIVVATGPLMKTKTGEVTVWASQLSIACKSLAAPPEKWKGLTDVEIRYRRRYIDLYSNPDTMRVFMLRSRLASTIRRFLDDRGFVEVETPVLQTLAGGAAARPFSTHMNALDIDLFMRIAPELYLKRLLVGGMPRVYEWARNFRNEGIDRSHNPEFTMMEVYEAFGDYTTMRDLTESLFRACAREVALQQAPATARAPGEPPAPEDLRLPLGDLTIDWGRPFEVVRYADLFEKGLGFSMNDRERVLKAAQERGVHTKNKAGVALDHLLLVNELFDDAEAALDPARPTFVLDYPAPLCPLTRPKTSDPAFAERFELFVGGMELANAYTELNDPDVQEQRFREQLTGIDDEESTFRTFDEDFVRALKVGMPPAGGLGIGIDRLCMAILNQRTIRDVVLFPMMKPEAGE